MDPSVKISALAITLNESEHIEAFIKSLWFADEIIIVDSFSTDATVSLAESADKVTVYQRTFDNFSSQKNFAISKAQYDWVVFFDPDEHITKPLADEIVATVASAEHQGYLVKRDFYFMDRHIKHSGFQSDWVVRLFKRSQGQYNGNLVHETLSIDGTTGKLQHSLPHYTYKNFDDYTRKQHNYSALQAQMMYDKGKKATLFHFLIRPWYRFWHQYIVRLGFLDGKEGFILAYVSAFTVFKRYVNLWLLYRKID
ncbi:MAG: glycosyltransferase family 2 protein [Marinirhabdus sp.]|nr:glycosyltransferase family 2 protein [Marinirhabdus sp.]